ncbi:MAG TPA: acetyl-CoA hydrolase/transferase family protein [Dehalococcoidia bacterium]|nr:acetyl-CoA hydrolase/transferase family protein [Dehalococcoidia bacterium]
MRFPHITEDKEYRGDWQDDYKRKLVSAEDAAKVVKSGDRVALPFAHPTQVPLALGKRKDELKNVYLEINAPSVDPGWLQPGWEEHFFVGAINFLGPMGRPSHDAKVTSFIPCLMSLRPKLIDEGRRNWKSDIDVFMTNVAPPDKNGFCSFGPHLWNKKSYAQRAKTVIAEVDENMVYPYRGNNLIHVSEIDYFVEAPTPRVTDEQLRELILTTVKDESKHQVWIDVLTKANKHEPEYMARGYNLMGPLMDILSPDFFTGVMGLEDPYPEAEVMAGYVRELIRDGDTIEIGAGRPTTWLPRVGLFDGFQDLGVHSEMTAWGQHELIEQGIFNGKRKTLHRGKAIYSALDGAGWDGYLWMSDNPLVEMYDCEYVHNPTVIAQNDNMVAINSVLQVDFTGQITCETQFGPRMINGPGGQLDFHLGAFMSRGGRAISMLRSLAFGGSSTIVPQLPEGSLATIPRQFADYVVTEYGIASLAGKSHRERANDLIAIAHPDFRAELKKEAQKLFYP